MWVFLFIVFSLLRSIFGIIEWFRNTDFCRITFMNFYYIELYLNIYSKIQPKRPQFLYHLIVQYNQFICQNWAKKTLLYFEIDKHIEIYCQNCLSSRTVNSMLNICSVSAWQKAYGDMIWDILVFLSWYFFQFLHVLLTFHSCWILSQITLRSNQSSILDNSI